MIPEYQIYHTLGNHPGNLGLEFQNKIIPGSRESGATGQAIKFRDNERGVGPAAVVQRLAQLPAIIPLATFGFFIGGDWLHVGAKMAGNSFSLRSKSEATPALPAG